MTETTPKKKITASDAWREARDLVTANRGRLAIGLLLMLVTRATGFVLPASSKLLIDDVMGQHKVELLPWLALAVGAATLVQAATSFALTQLLGVAGQRMIAEMRKRMLAHIA